MSATSMWLLFVVIGLGTFLQRFLFIYLFGKIVMPEWLRSRLAICAGGCIGGSGLPGA